MHVIRASALVCCNNHRIVYLGSLLARGLAGLRASRRRQIVLPLASPTPKPSRIVAGGVMSARTAARAARRQPHLRARIRKAGTHP
jgi:hypothetical protein